MNITINDDFDLYKIAYSGQCFRVKELDKDTFSFVTAKNKITITDLDYGKDDCQHDGRNFDVSASLDEWNSIWTKYFDLDTSYCNIRKMIPADDKYMVNCAELGKGIRILRQDKFEMLLSFITSQRKSIPAIKTSVERMCSLYGSDGFFPEPAQMLNATSEELSSCGLGYRVNYILDAVRKVALNEVDLEALDMLDDEALFTELKSFKGVGDKVANCVELFAYHRTGRAPIDTWIKKVIDTQYNGINPFPSYNDSSYPLHNVPLYKSVKCNNVGNKNSSINVIDNNNCAGNITGNIAGIMQQYVFYAAQHMRQL